VRHGIQVSVIDTPLSKTFESLLLSVRDGVQSFAFVVIYRPDPSSTLNINDDFFVDFADVLERTATFARCVIVGDVNIHLDDVNSTQVSRLVALLDDCGLHDVVGQPTHTRGSSAGHLCHTHRPTCSVVDHR